MSMIDFGNSVEEVQQKLREILPLVDAGQEIAEQLHNRMSGDLANFDETYTTFSEAVKAIGEVGTQVGDQVSDWESDLSTVSEDWGSRLDGLVEQTNTVWKRLEEGQEVVKSTLNEMHTDAETTADDISTSLEAMFESTNSFNDKMTQLRESITEKCEAVDESLANLANEWESTQKTAEESLAAFQSTISDDWSNRLGETVKGITESTTADAVSIGESIAKHGSGLLEFFSTFQSDSETLADEYANKASEILVGLKDYAENEISSQLTEIVEGLIQNGLANFGASIGLSVATTQIGVVTTSALSPVLPEIAVAKKLTDLINSVF